MVIDVYVATQKGSDKERSEDYILVVEKVLNDSSAEFEKIEPPFIVAVADGVGGDAGGENAAEFVVSELKQYDFQVGSSDQSVSLFLTEINCRLLKYSASIPGKERMATTLSGIICDGEKAFGFHIGNTRIYSIQGSYLKQLTEDQTTAQWLKNIGNSEAVKFCNKSEIISCMGGGNAKLFDGLKIFKIEQWKNIKSLVLTSDGVHDYIDIDDLEDKLCNRDITRQTCDDVINFALQKGSHDDMTIAVIKNV